MSSLDYKFDALREKAKQLLEKGDIGSFDIADDLRNMDSLVEELQIYDVELKLQNKQLVESERRLESTLAQYKHLFTSLPFATMVLDQSAIIVQANDLAAQLFGFRNKNVIENHSLYRLVTENDRNEIFNSIKQQVDGNTTHIGPITIGKSSRQLVDFYLTRLPESYHLDTRILLNIVERTKQYEDLKKYLLLQTIVDTAESCISAFDEENRCIFANENELSRIGKNSEDVLGRRRDHWLSVDEALENERLDATVFTTRERYVYEEKQISEIGIPSYYLVHKFPLLDKEANIFGIGTIATEITRSKSQDEKIDLLMSAYAMGKDGILITDENNDITMVNSTFESITGYKEHEVLGRNPRLLSSGRHDKEFYHKMWETVKDTGFWEGEVWNRRKNNEIYPEHLSISRVLSKHKVQNYIGVFSDLTNRKMAEEEIEHLAFYDLLTGLPNRNLLADRIGQAISRAKRSGENFSLVFIDLNKFKNINDVYSHSAGDYVLKVIADRIKELVREGDTLSRVGGDEFILILDGINKNQTKSRIFSIFEAVNKEILFDQKKLKVSASFGVACYPGDGESIDDLMKNADTAMYEAKSSKFNYLEFFDAEMSNRVEYELRVQYALSEALENGEMYLMYQPQLDLNSHEIIGAEALLRWDCPGLGAVSPAVFIPIAEASGDVLDIGGWVLKEALSVIKKINVSHADFKMAINISAYQFQHKNFLDDLDDLKQSIGFNPQNVELEITETMIMENPDWSIEVLKKLKEMGFKLSLDDFGTGYSSMAYLRWMPLDLLKLDQSFVMGIHESNSKASICQSIISLAHSLGYKALAEGVESSQSMDFLKLNNCDYAQGFLISHPIMLEKLEAKMAQS